MFPERKKKCSIPAHAAAWLYYHTIIACKVEILFISPFLCDTASGLTKLLVLKEVNY
jgi:hypothetical protein